MFSSWNKDKNLKDVGCEASKHANDMCETVYDDSLSLRDNIRSNPVQSSILALVAGYILGRIFSL